jgi:hypothetical protein
VPLIHCTGSGWRGKGLPPPLLLAGAQGCEDGAPSQATASTPCPYTLTLRPPGCQSVEVGRCQRVTKVSVPHLHPPPPAPGDPDLTPSDPNPAGPGRATPEGEHGSGSTSPPTWPNSSARGRPRAHRPDPARPGPANAHTLTAVPAAAPPALLGQAGAPDQRPPRRLERVHGPLQPPTPPPKTPSGKLSARPGGARAARSSLPGASSATTSRGGAKGEHAPPGHAHVRGARPRGPTSPCPG